MRIGEVAIVGPPDFDKAKFLNAVCSEVIPTTPTLCFGRLQISKNLLVHVYGINTYTGFEAYAWDLISTKLLGFIVAYHWFDRRSFESAQHIVDLLQCRYEVPLLVAADTDSRPSPAPMTHFPNGLRLSRDQRLVFYKAKDAKSIRRAYTTLLDMVVDQVQDAY